MSRIVLVGAGHCHIEIARNAARFINRGHAVTLISPTGSQPYSGMGPGLLGGTYELYELMLPAGDLLEQAGGEFRCASVIGHSCDTKTVALDDGSTIEYDVISFNIGSEPVNAAKIDNRRVFGAKPIAGLLNARRAIASLVEDQIPGSGRTARIAVVGGGPAGVELAGNTVGLAHRLGASRFEVTLISATDSIAGVRGSRCRYVERTLRRSGVTVEVGRRVDPTDADADIVLYCAGIRPPAVSARLGLALNDEGAIRVDRFLRVEGCPHAFAVGDCAHFTAEPIDRVGVYAVRMQATLEQNLMRTADQSESTGTPERAGRLKAFTGTGAYLAGVNLGLGTGLLYKGAFELRGRAGFRLKDYIDRRFIRRYQSRRARRQDWQR